MEEVDVVKHQVLVYGTLRKGAENAVVLVPGTLYNLGWFPGIKLDRSENPSSFVTCEVLEVDDDKLFTFDNYEGYDPTDPENSLYIREEWQGKFIYTFNKDVQNKPVIASGNWLDVPNATLGAYA